MKYSDFKPNNIFEKDSKGNDVFFFIFSAYIIKDTIKRNKLIDLMGSRFFYFSYKPPILLFSIIIAFKIYIVLSFVYDLSEFDSRGLIILLSIIIYVFFLLIYLLRIIFTLKGCEKIGKAEKIWISENKK